MKNKLLWMPILSALFSCTTFMQTPAAELSRQQLDKLLEDFTRIRIEEHLYSNSIPATNRELMIRAANENQIAPQIAFYFLQKDRQTIFNRLFQ